MPDVLVKKSKISGKGIFAARDFKKGEVVLKWDSSRALSEQEAKALPEEEQDYISFLGGKYILMQPPERFVNHSCEANTSAKNFCDIANRNIKKGEEITADYEEVLPHWQEMDCRCGSKKCRHKIRNATI